MTDFNGAYTYDAASRSFYKEFTAMGVNTNSSLLIADARVLKAEIPSNNLLKIYLRVVPTEATSIEVKFVKND